LNIENMNF